MTMATGAVTLLVETVNEAESCPASTITEAGTVAALESLGVRLTVALAV